GGRHGVPVPVDHQRWERVEVVVRVRDRGGGLRGRRRRGGRRAVDARLRVEALTPAYVVGDAISSGRRPGAIVIAAVVVSSPGWATSCSVQPSDSSAPRKL